MGVVATFARMVAEPCCSLVGSCCQSPSASLFTSGLQPRNALHMQGTTLYDIFQGLYSSKCSFGQVFWENSQTSDISYIIQRSNDITGVIMLVCMIIASTLPTRWFHHSRVCAQSDDLEEILCPLSFLVCKIAVHTVMFTFYSIIIWTTIVVTKGTKKGAVSPFPQSPLFSVQLEPSYRQSRTERLKKYEQQGAWQPSLNISRQKWSWQSATGLRTFR